MSKAAKAWYGVRFAAIGSVAKGLGLVNREWGRQYLVREISRMPGLPAKMAQLLETKYAQPGWSQLSGLALPVEWVKEQILSESPKLAAEILEISEEGMTASLGQVHWARLRDGREVAIKVQFPEVAGQVADQLDLLLHAMAAVPSGRKFGLDVEAYGKFLREFFQREVDYQQEGEGQARFRAAWAPLGGVVVPEVFPEWCSKRILVQSFESATWLESLTGEPPPVRQAACEALARMLLVGSLRLGLIHTDLHPRNWGFRPGTKELVLYDFGATLRLDEGMRQALQALFLSPDDSPVGCLTRFGDLGFDVAKLSHITHQLPELLDVLTEPLHHRGLWSASQWRVNERIEAVLGSDRWWFRVSGPPWFLLLMRGIFGAVKSMERLQAGVDLAKVLAEGVGLAVPPTVSGRHGHRPAGDPAAARNLRVEVREGEAVIVDLEFPARVVEDLEFLIPPEVGEKLAGKGVNILELKKAALASGLRPQELFQASQGKRSYRVWLA